jgi:hypothetical protein
VSQCQAPIIKEFHDLHSWGIVDVAFSLKLIINSEGEDLKRGFYYV